jgi:putative ABC transport system ATP-binding protein
MSGLLHCTGVTKAFRAGTESRTILDNVSLEIREGEFVSVMGPSGSGKSTLLYTLSGMDTVDGGTVWFDGTDISGLNEPELANLRRTAMGFVFQQPTLLRNLTILDNIILPAARENRRNVGRIVEKALMLMERTGIAGLEDRSVTEASGGQLQRVGICRALMNDPRIIFGDEPTGALHSAASDQIMSILGDIHRAGATILLVTHDPRVAARTERVVVIQDGRIAGERHLGAFDATCDDLRTREDELSGWLTELECA